ncbi:MAG: M20/M25/M40 family metallo-hydrolase [Caldisericaceae bacterium]|nr:M20/M25/M40 family metallo-hydrolase [Caldisericaceae bacterium]
MNEELLKSLTDSFTVTGYEENLHSVILNALKGYTDKIESLKNGSLYALKKGKPGKCTLMLDAHIDEVGMFVTGITDEGFLRIHTRSIDPKVLPGSVVVVHGKKDLKGVIGLKPYHLQSKEEMKKYIPIDQLFVDCGMSNKEIRQIVNIGDTVSFLPDFVKLQNLISNKSIDDRAGVYVIIEVLKNLKRITPLVNVIGHFASQEEVTGLGALTSTYYLKPDFAIAIDVTHGTSPGVTSREAYQLGKGPVLFVGPGIDHIILQKLVDTAKKFGIPVQKEIGILSGTDQTEIQIVGKGVPSAVVSLPQRYMHTPVEVIDPEDIKNTINLLTLFIEEIDETFMEELYGEH